MKLSRTANGEENSSANTSSEAAPGPLPPRKRLFRSRQDFISTAPSRKRTVSPTRNACLDTFEVYTFFQILQHRRT
ncbi:hypothetical protein TNCV_4088961 [Trichonephila clavipes]|nr:hypothetical protein TNCV_4088961 [Trichonephila clavipes]